MGSLVSLDDDDARDVEVVGAKAARLADARRWAFPVLPGLIVPIQASRPAMDAGRRAVSERGAGAARMAVLRSGMDQGLASDLTAAAQLGPTLIARSSARVDDDGAWSGAFATVHDVGHESIVAAVSACWASVFAPDALERHVSDGGSPADAGIAVLIQRQVEPRAGGWARTVGDLVEVAAVPGTPAPLMRGVRRGSLAVLDRDGTVVDGDLPGMVDVSVLRQLVGISVRAREDLGCDRVEWGVEDDSVLVFQVDRIVANAEPPPEAVQGGFDGVGFQRLAATLADRRGPLVDRLVAPWAGAAPGGWSAEAVDGAPRDLWDRATTLADRLASAVAHAVGRSPEDVVAFLAAGDADIAARVAAIAIDPGSAEHILGAVGTVGADLAGRGHIGTPEEIWWQSPDWIDDAIASGMPPPARRWVGDRWLDLVFGVSVHHGSCTVGSGASPGQAAGRAVAVRTPEDAGSFPAGGVLVVDQPLPTFAPLLWRASGLVARDGNLGAHLFEVARSLRVPAVVGAALDKDIERSVVAVDGDTGRIWTWRGGD